MQRPARAFEDLVVGESARSRTLAIAREDMIEFAKRYDPQWFHTDAEAAKSSVFGEVIASGVYTMAIWRSLDHEINGDVDFICGVAWENVRWKAMRAGDVVYAVSEIVDKQPSKSDPGRGTAVFRYALVNQHGAEIFSCRSISLVRRRT